MAVNTWSITSQIWAVGIVLPVIALCQVWGKYAIVVFLDCSVSLLSVTSGISTITSTAYKSFQQQSSVWGLRTKGGNYQFVDLMRGNPCNQILPELSLIDRERSLLLAQVLKAICKLQNVQLQLAWWLGIQEDELRKYTWFNYFLSRTPKTANSCQYRFIPPSIVSCF